MVASLFPSLEDPGTEQNLNEEAAKGKLRFSKINGKLLLVTLLLSSIPSLGDYESWNVYKHGIECGTEEEIMNRRGLQF